MSAMPGIVVGIDGSDHSELALEWAMKEAGLRHQPVTVLAVHQVVTSFFGTPQVYLGDRELVEPVRAAAQEMADKVLAALTGPRPESVTIEAVSGIPAEALISVAGDMNADMIVLGSRGAGGFARLALGSVSSQVAHHATCPVVIIPSGIAR
jgi:nucleotide-binding universal stress UspA family protein